MSNSVVSSLGRAVRWLWWLLDASRRTLLNLLFLLLLGVLLWALLRPGLPALQPKTALVLNLAGPVTEQRAGSARDAALKQLQGQDDGQMQLRDLLAVLDAAAKDPNISHALLVLDDFRGGGLPTLRELAAAIDRFKAAGKSVVAWGSDFDQRSYFVASHANEIWLHPMGHVLPEGFGRYRTYYKDAFDRFGLQANLLRVGKFKSAAEPYIANAPSPETLEAEGLLYGALWADWTGSVEKARKLPAGHIDKLLAALPGSLSAVGGDAAKLAQDSKLVDALKTRDEMRALMIQRGAANDGDKAEKTFRQVSFGEYLGRIKPKRDGNAVGVIVAEGEISDGQAPSGRIGGQSTAALVRQAREDNRIKAVVLRVDSPGGSAFGSELVRRELELTRAAGKPVVVSMGDVAASGGYWITTAADEVIADPATITGSIGVFALLPNAQGALDKLGLHTGGTTTSWLTGAVDPRRALDPRMAELIQASIEHIYRNFTTLAATARKTTPEKINEVAQGRVWTGQQALERGLVDRVGSYGDALASAAKRAKLEPVDGVYRVTYLDREPGRLERLLGMLGVSSSSVMARVLSEVVVAVAPGLLAADPVGQALLPGAPAAVLDGLRQDLGWMTEVADRRKPFAAVVHCLCTAP
jgi:protease-4